MSQFKTTHREQDAGKCSDWLVGYTRDKSSQQCIQAAFLLCAENTQTQTHTHNGFTWCVGFINI